MENEEQLNFSQNANLIAVEQPVGDTPILSGESMLNSSSKFKSVEALEKAYENLEKEFTKKCQALNKLLSDNNEKALPQYSKENWLEKVGEFIKEHPLATSYSKQIAEVLTENEELSTKEDALSLAYSKVLENNFKTKEELVKDQEFLNEFVFSNENIKTKIIEEYLNNITSSKTVPLISNTSGTSSISSPKFKPKNLKEASLYATQILKK